MKIRIINSQILSKLQKLGLFTFILLFAVSCSDNGEGLYSTADDIDGISTFIGKYHVNINDCMLAGNYTIEITNDFTDVNKVFIANIANTNRDVVSAELTDNGFLYISSQSVRVENESMKISGSVDKTDSGLAINYLLIKEDVVKTCSVNGLEL